MSHLLQDFWAFTATDKTTSPWTFAWVHLGTSHCGGNPFPTATEAAQVAAKRNSNPYHTQRQGKFDCLAQQEAHPIHGRTDCSYDDGVARFYDKNNNQNDVQHYNAITFRAEGQEPVHPDSVPKKKQDTEKRRAILTDIEGVS